MKNGGRTALYLRLSKEDKDKLNKGDSSASIQNQKLLLTEYALEHRYEIVEIYCDDDESGLFDNRPGFERMLADARLGKFDILLAKSQSRFSRNLEHVEKYLHHDFIRMGIRFIGVADGADTANQENKKSRQINGLVNEWYCEDLSKNIRSAFHAKMKDGQFLGASCPYGYKKDPNNHNHLIVDSYAAEIVKKIYSLYLQGYGKAKIGKILTGEGVLIPTQYKREVLGIAYYNAHESASTKNWSYQTIHTILNNEVYTGNLVQNRSSNLSYKDKKHIRQPKENWIIVKNCHEAIIDAETFQSVQKRQKTRTKSIHTKGRVSLFSGILFCADCKHAMVKVYQGKEQCHFSGYCCKTYKTQGKQNCTSHKISFEQLKEAVLHSLREEAKKILTEEDVQLLEEEQSREDSYAGYEHQIHLAQKQIEEKEKYKRITYKNYMEEILTKEEYLEYKKEFDAEICEMKERTEILKEQWQKQKKKEEEDEQWIKSFINYIGIKNLTREVVQEMIEKIEVNEDSSITIFYQFTDRSIAADGSINHELPDIRG